MTQQQRTRVTQLLHNWRDGRPEALEELMPLVYAELENIARREFRSESADHTLQPTALINEAVLRLVDNDIGWQDRCHFLAMMTTTMRRVLVDHARRRSREKRGGNARKVTLLTNLASVETAPDILDLDQAIDALSAIDTRKAEIVQLHYFGGMKYNEISVALAISEATVDRDLRFSKAWLGDYLKQRS